jgi:carboxyl-terminal processing protease
MRPRVYIGVFWLVAWFASLPLVAWGQQPSTVRIAPASLRSSAIDALLDRGRLLETQRRWGEALTLYEDALRQFPHGLPVELPEPAAGRDSNHQLQAERGLIQQRLQLSRTHYDLGRRYADNSFRQSLAAMSARDALNLYGEVLLKIQSHYVESPDWRRLVEHGSRGFEVALSDPLFLETNLPHVPKAQIDHFRRQFRSLLPIAPADSRQAAQAVAAAAGRLSREQLGLSETVAIVEYTCAAGNSLDAYSTYLTAGQLNEVYAQIEGNFVGLGIELKAADGALAIVKVIRESPAERGGIRAGDRIVAVDGASTADLTTDQAANLLQGKEGSWVEVTAASAGTAPRTLRIRREHVDVPSIDDARIVDETLGIAYLKLTCFQKTTSRDLDLALRSLHAAGMKSLVIDLRGNPGGLLNTAVDVADRFLDRGIIVSTRGRSPQEDFTYSARQAGTWRMPLVVLIDGDSASASEIFAGAIRDHRRGRIVGGRSYGKGSVQGIFPLTLANSGLRLTTAKFYSPKGRAYSDVGVQPDVLVQQAARPAIGETGAHAPSIGSDAAFEAAVREAGPQPASR